MRAATSFCILAIAIGLPACQERNPLFMGGVLSGGDTDSATDPTTASDQYSPSKRGAQLDYAAFAFRVPMVAFFAAVLLRVSARFTFSATTVDTSIAKMCGWGPPAEVSRIARAFARRCSRTLANETSGSPGASIQPRVRVC